MASGGSGPGNGPPRVYKEGILYKRARGLHKKRINWQERYCKLTSTSLDYYDPGKKQELKGQFHLKQICIIEIIAHGTFDKLKGHPFQIGDQTEVMYFAGRSPQDRTDWMEAFRLASLEYGNQLLLKHHPGVYGLTNKDRWSCCGRSRKECEGCADSRGAMKALGNNQVNRERSITTPMDFLGDGPATPKTQRDELTGSLSSNTSDTTITEGNEESGIIRRTFTISTADRPRQRPLSKISSTSSSSRTTSPKSPTPVESIPETIKESDGSNRNSLMMPPKVDEITRSGASSPALSTDSGRGTSSRPRSLEGENPPSTPHSARSTFTTVTNDSDNSKIEGGGTVTRPKLDTVSLLSDTSGASYFSGMSPNPHTISRIKKNRQSVLITNNGMVVHLDNVEGANPAMGEVMMKLHQGCKDGNLEIVQDEYDTGAPLGEQQIFNGVPMLPLFIAFLYDHRHIIKFLLEHEADPNALDMTSRSCILHLACQKGAIEIAQMLIQFKADVNMRNYEDNTPLCEACKHGHLDVVKLLIESEAVVDFEGGNRYTPLHYAAESGHLSIVQLLLEKGANLLRKTVNNCTPYHLAFENNHDRVTELLCEKMPPSDRPYKHVKSCRILSGQVVSSVTFTDTNQLVAGSWDCHVRVWDDTEEEPIQEFKLSNTVLGVSYHAPFLVAASTTIQVTNSTNYDWKRTIADDSTEDESLEDPPLHMATYCPDGHLITATAESNIIKIWPPTSTNSVGGSPKNTIKVQEKTKDVGTIKRICVSPVDELPWLGAVIQPGPLLSPKNTKKVFIYNWKEDKIYHILDTGKGGLEFNVEMSFAYDGEYMIIGYNNKLTKWHTQSGEMEMDFDMLKKDDIITAISCSPNSTHAAVGLTNGDIKIIDYETAQLTFTLRNNNIHTPAVSSLSYSADGNNLASGHTGGLVQIWKKEFTTQEC